MCFNTLCFPQDNMGISWLIISSFSVNKNKALNLQGYKTDYHQTWSFTKICCKFEMNQALTGKFLLFSSGRQTHARNSCGPWTPNPWQVSVHKCIEGNQDAHTVEPDLGWKPRIPLSSANPQRVSKSLSNQPSNTDIYKRLISSTMQRRSTGFEHASCCESHVYVLKLSCRWGAMMVPISLACLTSREARQVRIQLCHRARMPHWRSSWLLCTASTALNPWERHGRWLCTKGGMENPWANLTPFLHWTWRRHGLEYAAPQCLLQPAQT